MISSVLQIIAAEAIDMYVFLRVFFPSETHFYHSALPDKPVPSGSKIVLTDLTRLKSHGDWTKL